MGLPNILPPVFLLVTRSAYSQKDLMSRIKDVLVKIHTQVL